MSARLILLLLTVVLFMAYQSEATYGYGPTPDQLITEAGYPFKVHNVTTADGYVLTLYQIVGGRNEEPGANNKTALLLMPGIASNCGVFILQAVKKSLPFILADAGFDLWMGGFRGTLWSRKNVNVSDDSNAFWNFNIQQTGEYDLAAIVDYMKAETGLEKILYAAHSMGAAALMILLSLLPEYAESFAHAYLFAPAVFLGHTTSSLANLAPLAPSAAEVIKLTSHGEVPFDSPTSRAAIVTLCTLTPALCTLQRNSVSGEGTADPEKIDDFYKYFPGSCSIDQLQHYAQGVHKKKQFNKFDYGAMKNMLVYGSASPPSYNLSNVSACVPVSLYYGETDALADKEDVEDLASVLPNVKRVESAYNGTFSHFDFLAGEYSTQFYFNLLQDIKDDLENHDNCSCVLK